MTKKMKKKLHHILAGGAIYIFVIIVKWFVENDSMIRLPRIIMDNMMLLLFLAVYIFIAGDIIKKVIKNFMNEDGMIETLQKAFDENFLMVIATVGAFLIKDYSEAIAVILFYQVGEFFQSYAINQSRKSIADAMDIRPEYANVIRDEMTVKVMPEEVHIGEFIVIKPGERVPLDGIVSRGTTTLDTKALTGESMPREIVEGDEIASGCINLSGLVEAKVTKVYGESTVTKILKLVEDASANKAKAENFITKFARLYTPMVVGAAILLAIVPPIVLGGGFREWLYRALTFLVISCPCALVISIPLSFFGGIGGASRKGILIKGSNYLEELAGVSVVVMDKTGTLTKGTFTVTKIVVYGDDDGRMLLEPPELLKYAAYAENYSSHPIAVSLREAYYKVSLNIKDASIDEVKESAGFGVCAKIEGKIVLVGNEKWLRENNIVLAEKTSSQTVKTLINIADYTVGTEVHIAIDNVYVGYILISDEIKADSIWTVGQLKKMGIKSVMLTGDKDEVSQEIAKKLGINEVYTELLPEDKVQIIERYINRKSANERLLFVGDGINDAPVLAGADIGIAMGGLGSDAAIEAADIVIMTDEPSKIITALHISKKTHTIVKQNIIFALGVKAIILILAAFGIANMWAAVFADVGVAFIAILNAMRALRVD